MALKQIPSEWRETKMERNRIGWKRRMVMIMIIKKIIYQHH